MNIIDKDGLILLEGIPFGIDPGEAASQLKIPAEGPDFKALRGMIAGAASAGSPKAAYRECFLSGRKEDSLLIGGERFASRILRVNLENAHRVFLYVVTCGRELDAWSGEYSDPLLSYFADYIKETVLARALEYFYGYIERKYRLKKYSRMAPGSLRDWPLSEQAGLFKALAGSESPAGVELTDSFLMVPSKSVSGVLFPTEITFESCMLCPRERCPGRKAPYDETLYRRRYSKAGGNACIKKAEAAG